MRVRIVTKILVIHLNLSILSLRPFSNSHTNPDEGFQAGPPVNQQILVPLHDARFKQHDQGRSTKRKKPELVTSLHLLTFPNRRLDAAHHHGPNAHRENPSELWAVDRYHLSCVLAVDVESGSDRLWLETDINGSAPQRECDELDGTHVDGVVLPRNGRHLPDLSIHG